MVEELIKSIFSYVLFLPLHENAILLKTLSLQAARDKSAPIRTP